MDSAKFAVWVFNSWSDLRRIFIFSDLLKLMPSVSHFCTPERLHNLMLTSLMERLKHPEEQVHLDLQLRCHRQSKDGQNEEDTKLTVGVRPRSPDRLRPGS